jgi:L-alanine-DL-glutamate epimerase-like enolase superfamily enzyme
MHDLVEEKPPLVDGRIIFPETPGLGLTIREDFVREYTI